MYYKIEPTQETYYSVSIWNRKYGEIITSFTSRIKPSILNNILTFETPE
ncbi:unnamed protein product, partial [marine sediment metagenome]